MKLDSEQDEQSLTAKSKLIFEPQMRVTATGPTKDGMSAKREIITKIRTFASDRYIKGPITHTWPYEHETEVV